MFYKLKTKYGYADFIRIPFKAAPWGTSAVILQKLLSAFLPSVRVILTADFIDTAAAIFKTGSSSRSIYTPLILLMLTVAYEYLSWCLISAVDLGNKQKIEKYFKGAVIEKRARLEYRHIENNGSWDLISRTCDKANEQVNTGFETLMSAASIIIKVASLLAIIIAEVWWTGFAVVAISVPLFFIAYKGGKASYEANKEAMKHTRRADYLRSILQGRDNTEERSLFGYSDEVGKRWYEKYETARKINMKTELKYFIRMKSSSLVTVFISAAIIGILMISLVNGDMSSGMFISLVTATLNLVQMMSWELSWTMQQLVKCREFLNDLTAFSNLTETPGTEDMPAPKGSVLFESLEFKNVTFGYPDTEKIILRDFSLKLVRGRHYAFVGINGAGKTTVTKLLTGMYSNYTGEILVNGKELREYTQAEIKILFGVVYQDFAKYYIPMDENIALGNVNSRDREEIEKAIYDIGLDECVSALPQGIKTWLGKIKDSGQDISGGEWQRVAIARILYNPAEVRILDEPTAALDPVAESEVYSLFGRISTGKSTIFITHRLGAARLADEIIVIDEGKVAEKGSHSELIGMGGIYAGMFEAQRSWYK